MINVAFSVAFNFIINVAFSFIIDVALNVFIHVFINRHIRVYTFLRPLTPLHYRYDAGCFQGVFLPLQIGPQF